MSKPIFVIGGMGPQASSHLLHLLVSQSSVRPETMQSKLHPEIIVHSLSVRDFISDDRHRPAAVSAVQSSLLLAKRTDPAAVAIACNTAHLLLAQCVAELKGLPFVSLIDTVSDFVLAQGMRRVGLLASPTTLRTKLYHRALATRGITVIEPTRGELPAVEAAIRAVIAQAPLATHRHNLNRIASRMAHAGADGLLLGCTELPLVFDKRFKVLPVFDCLEILSKRLLDLYNLSQSQE